MWNIKSFSRYEHTSSIYIKEGTCNKPVGYFYNNSIYHNNPDKRKIKDDSKKYV
jgi:hypothetical protein